MKAFFPRIAAVNLAGNKTAYLPYLLTSSVCVATFYIMLTFAISPEMARVPYATGAVMLFGFGTVIIGNFLRRSAVLRQQLSHPAQKKGIRTVQRARHGKAPCRCGAFL